MGLDSVELLMVVEEHFGIEIADADAAKLQTVGQLHAHVVAATNRRRLLPVDRDVVFAELRALICRQLGVDPERVVPTARFVDDLQID